MKTVLITGCSSGYGLETARHFHARGWTVIATMRTPRDGLLPASERIRLLPLDVTSAESIAAALDAAGPIDVLVNNAGIGVVGAFEATPLAHVRKVFETNTFGVMAMTQAVIPQMRARRSGVIVNVTSSVTLAPMPLAAAYTASKQAIEGFTGVAGARARRLRCARQAGRARLRADDAVRGEHRHPCRGPHPRSLRGFRAADLCGVRQSAADDPGKRRGRGGVAGRHRCHGAAALSGRPRCHRIGAGGLIKAGPPSHCRDGTSRGGEARRVRVTTQWRRRTEAIRTQASPSARPLDDAKRHAEAVVLTISLRAIASKLNKFLPDVVGHISTVLNLLRRLGRT